MAKLDGLETVLDFLKGLQPKIVAQIAKKVMSLNVDPFPADYKELTGYSGYYRSDLDLTESEELFHANFQPWLQERLGITSVASWAKLIMLTYHSEQEGFKQFFELLNEFQHQNIDRLQTGDLNEIYTQHNELEFQHR